MTALWTSAEIAAATGGIATVDFECGGVAFDSREIGKGDLFFALKGEQSDGHLFVEQAFAMGAAGAVVSQPVDFPHILVSDTFQALNDLARASRKRSKAKIIGVTGSAGKTSTKEALFAALARKPGCKVHRSVKSYNNHVGVPLSLARMPRDTDYGVFEMGMNHAGELSELTQLVRPHVAIVTTVGPAHIEFFADEAAIARAKAEIFEGLEAGGTAIIPADNPHYGLLAEQARKFATTVTSFGLSAEADVHAIDHIEEVGGGSLITASMRQALLCYNLSQPGEYWIANSLAVLAAVDAVEGDVAAAGLALAELGGLAGRGARQQISVPGGQALLIDESYNANPASMAATIGQLAEVDARRRIAILGAMKELGERSEEFHRGLAPLLSRANIDYALLVGEEMKILADSLASGLEGPVNFDHCANSDLAVGVLRNNLRDGDAILVKGSNSVGLSKIVAALVAGES